MGWLLGSAMLWFAGFALLIPVVPLWVIRGGSDDRWQAIRDDGAAAGTFLTSFDSN